MRTSILFVALWVFALDIAAPSILAEERTSWKAGLAKTRITPDKPLWMGGFGARTNVSQGTLQELYAKALALDDGSGRPAVLVTTDIVGFRATVAKNIAERAEKQYGLPRDRLILSSSHTHSGPLLADPLSIWYRWRLSAEQYRDVEDYTRELEDKVVAVVGAALRDLQPARLSFGYGEANFGVNRRREAEKGGAVSFVPNPEGPVDPHVPVLRVDSERGRLRGVVFGYACHTSTLLADNYRFCGDYAGFAEAWLEQQHPDAVAFFVQGCGADIMASPRGTVELARQYGETLGTCAAKVLDGTMRPVRGPLKCAFEVFPLAFAPPPSREELMARLQGQDTESRRQALEFLRASDADLRRHAQELLKILDGGGLLPTEYAYPLQVWQFGADLTLIAMAGEPVVDYALRLEKEYGAEGLWVAGYSNDVFAYIPSLRVLQEGGYESGGAIVGARLPGPFAPSIEETIVRKVHELVATVRGAAETPPAGYQLAWSDEFDGATLDMNKWSYRGLGRRHDALNVSDALSVGGGQLTITTYTSGGKHYTGMIGTEGKFERRFGYWEARLQFEGAPGMWSAFWIQTPTFGRPAGDPVTAGMEIDVIEHRVSDKSGKDISGKAQHAVHYGGSDKDVKSQSHVTDDLKLDSGFHTFGVEWTETEYRFFVDGKLTWTAAPVSKRPQYIILSSEVRDKSWAGAIPTDGYGPLEPSRTKMIVDYVRFYEPLPGLSLKKQH